MRGRNFGQGSSALPWGYHNGASNHNETPRAPQTNYRNAQFSGDKKLYSDKFRGKKFKEAWWTYCGLVLFKATLWTTHCIGLNCIVLMKIEQKLAT